MKISNGNIFGICMGVGLMLGLLLNKKYMTGGLFVGLGIGALIVKLKNKTNEKK